MCQNSWVCFIYLFCSFQFSLVNQHRLICWNHSNQQRDDRPRYQLFCFQQATSSKQMLLFHENEECWIKRRLHIVSRFSQFWEWLWWYSHGLGLRLEMIVTHVVMYTTKGKPCCCCWEKAWTVWPSCQRFFHDLFSSYNTTREREK